MNFVVPNYTYELNTNKKYKEKFLKGISHKIKTPLHAIMGYSEILLEENLKDQDREKIQSIYQYSNELLSIVNGILDLSKLENGNIEIVNREYDIQDIKKFVLNYLKENTKENIQILYDEKGDFSKKLIGDIEHIKKVLYHICNNAIQYTHDGFIKLMISSNIISNKCYLKIELSDSGIGIPEQKRNSVFSKFGQLGLDDDVHHGGIGASLMISKQLIEMMNGTIEVQSEENKGSTFTVFLEQELMEEIEILKLNEEKILVVDDNTTNIKVMSLFLEKMNILVDTALSGKEALEKISKNDYSLILMDDMMPEMTGTETMKILKEQNYEVPIIVCTANAMEGMETYYLNAGFDGYLPKPISKDALKKMIQKFSL